MREKSHIEFSARFLYNPINSGIFLRFYLIIDEKRLVRTLQSLAAALMKDERVGNPTDHVEKSFLTIQK